MKKADLLEEIRCELGLLVQKVKDKNEWYQTIIRILQEKIPYYKTIGIYLTNDTAFYYYKHEGDYLDFFEDKIPFGESYLSITAAKGEIACEFEPSGQLIYIPFYKGHYLLGEMIIKSTQFIDEDEFEFIKNIQELLSKVPK